MENTENVYICATHNLFIPSNQNITLLTLHLIKQFKLTPYNNVLGQTGSQHFLLSDWSAGKEHDWLARNVSIRLCSLWVVHTQLFLFPHRAILVCNLAQLAQ